jgi:hypothetical protein
MIDAKKAVQIAKERAMEMLGATPSLEEIERELYKERDVWSITLGLPRPLDYLTDLARLSAFPLQYKRFLIDVQTGELVAMKLRDEVALR